MTIDGYTIVAFTQHWRILDNHWHRDAWVRTPTGELKPVSIRTDVLGDQA